MEPAHGEAPVNRKHNKRPDALSHLRKISLAARSGGRVGLRQRLRVEQRLQLLKGRCCASVVNEHTACPLPVSLQR